MTAPKAPQDSNDGDDVQIQISATFHPGNELDIALADVTVETFDGVYFYVHTHRLLTPSSNAFNGLLLTEQGSVLRLPLSAVVTNILLHAVYGLDAQHFRPLVSDVVAAVDALQTYGLPISAFVAPGTPAFSLVLAAAPAAPLECYILAAAYELEPLAVAVSPYLLLVPLSELTDAAAMRIGPVYLRRLFFLHIGRGEALKRILLAPPAAHAPSADCGIFERRRLQNAWTLAVGSLTWELKPGPFFSFLWPQIAQC
jgi:hypothetical protein